MRSALLAFLAIICSTAHVRAAEAAPWAFPVCPPPTEGSAALPQPAILRVPGSTLRFTPQQSADRTVTRDWFPNEHEPLPAVLKQSHAPTLAACGYCHLADGSGRPENAKVSGLPVDYIVAQVRAIDAHARHPLEEGWLPTKLMADSAASLSAADIAMAAEYYAKQKPRSFVKVVETEQVPAYRSACFVLKRSAGPKLALKEAIVEMPDAFERFEARDPHTTYTAYVPLGSIARGLTLAQGGAGRIQPCGNCHGADLKGNTALGAPPIAGRFATYIYRQLLGFKSGARSGAAAQPMAIVAAKLGQSDFIDLAAYAASLTP